MDESSAYALAGDFGELSLDPPLPPLYIELGRQLQIRLPFGESESIEPQKKETANLRRALLSTIPRILNSSATHSSSLSISPIPSQTLHRPFLGSISRFYSLNHENQSVDIIDLSTEESKRRLFNRLTYRSKQRGYLELDLILGKWVEENINSMDESAIRPLVDVLNLENPDLWKWLTGQEQPPEAINSNPVFIAFRTKVMNNLDSHASPKTRATAGQPWVRAWDDFKKGQDSPIVGNQ